MLTCGNSRCEDLRWWMRTCSRTSVEACFQVHDGGVELEIQILKSCSQALTILLREFHPSLLLSGKDPVEFSHLPGPAKHRWLTSK